MAEFAKPFFEDEIRDGFYIRSDTKRLWAANIEVLCEVDRICKKHGISYFADFGTLLGAVRHNGYIPWDDDLDIVMMRDDYMRFCGIAEEELQEPFICADIYHSKTWPLPFARVINGVGINLSLEFLKRFHGCAYSAGVDIFILDNMPEAENEFYIIRDLFALMKLVREKLKKESVVGEEIEKALCQIEDICKIKIDRKKNINHQLMRIADGFGALNANHWNRNIFDICFISHGNYFYAGYKREWYREAIELPFENITVPVPVDYDKVLEYEYGNYLKPIKGPAHDIYKAMEIELQRAKKDIGNICGRIEKVQRRLEQ